MKIQIVSDLHLEFIKNPVETWQEYLEPSASYLALLGDICPLNDKLFKKWLLHVCPHYKKVFYVFGNHEFYDTSPQKAMCQTVSNFFTWVNKNISNLIILNNSSVDLDGYRIIGGTMWTKIDQNYKYIIESKINDYKQIVTHLGKLTVDDTNVFHAKFCHFLRQECKKAEKDDVPVIVFTHHAPLMENRLQNKKYWGDECCQAYMTDMREFMTKNIILWAFGHTHHSTDFIYNNQIQIYSNPKGYKSNKDVTKYDKTKIVEV